jgi:CRP-like cAMP-binding protein
MNPKSNSLLAQLPQGEYERLSQHMQLVSLSQGETLLKVGESQNDVYFPVGAIISVMSDMPDGKRLEICMLGKTSIVCVGIMGQPSDYRLVVRTSGLAYKIATSHLMEVRDSCPVYTQAINQAFRKMMRHMSQTAYCNKEHPMEQQIVSWLLINLDNGLSSQIDITHQELSSLLNFRREGVTLALQKLSKLGLVDGQRGMIEVIDRAGLEAASCDCYWSGQALTRPLFSPLINSTD